VKHDELDRKTKGGDSVTVKSSCVYRDNEIWYRDFVVGGSTLLAGGRYG